MHQIMADLAIWVGGRRSKLKRSGPRRAEKLACAKPIFWSQPRHPAFSYRWPNKEVLDFKKITCKDYHCDRADSSRFPDQHLQAQYGI